MSEEKLSKEYYKILKKIRTNEIMFITEEIKSQCEFLKSEEYIDMLDVAIINSYNPQTKDLNLDTCKIIAQITHKGKNYCDLHDTWLKKIRWEYVISIIAIIASFSDEIIPRLIEFLRFLQQ